MKGNKKTSAAPANRGMSMLPEDLSGGLPGDFDGVITSAAVSVWDYGGTADEYVCAVRFEVTRDDDGEIEEVWLKAESLEDAFPSKDGRKPVDLDGWDGEDLGDVSGPYFVQVGNKQRLTKLSNFGMFLTKLYELRPDARDLAAADITWLVGLHGHWDRVEREKFKTRKGETVEGKEVLLVTKVFELPGEGKKGKAGKKTAKPSKVSKKDEEEEEDEEEETPKPVAKKPAKRKPAPQEETEEEDEDADEDEDEDEDEDDEEVDGGDDDDTEDDDSDVEDRFRKIITDLARKPILRRQLPSKVLAAAPPKMKADLLALADSEKFLKKLAKEGIIAYDGETISKGKGK